MPNNSPGGGIVRAWKDGVDIINADKMNQTLALQPFALIYEGNVVDSKVGSGVTENNLANNSYCARFTLTIVTELTRIELHLDRDGDGADVTIQIRSGMDPATGVEGTTELEVVVPKEFIPATAAYWSVAINLSSLTSGGLYHIVVPRAGDATNKVDWIGEASQDASYPAYCRVGNSGAWTPNNALHFKVYAGDDGDLIHGIYDASGYTTCVYGDVDGIPQISEVYRYLPPSDGSAGGIRDKITIAYSNGKIKGGA